jgi:hypothetical protein
MRKPRRSRLMTSALSDHQRELLLHGFDLFERPRWVDTDAVTPEESRRMAAERERQDFPHGGAERAWKQHRAELLPELGPGHRPSAFWRFDVQVVPPCSWWAEIGLLLQYNLISVAEAFAVEAEHRVLVLTFLPPAHS